MLPFYSSVLTPEEQENIEKIDPEEFTEELGKVSFLRPGGHRPRLGLHLLMGATTPLLPLIQFPGDNGLHRDGEFLEKVQQSETGATEPSTQTCPVVGNQ